MSMTREEAIINLKKLIALFHTASEQSKMVDYSKIIETLEFAAAALRPVSREQVEKSWKGCEYCSGDVDNRSYLDSKRLYLDKNGLLTDEIENIDILRLSFCPVCGKPLTDEAVEMVMERLEALWCE